MRWLYASCLVGIAASSFASLPKGAVLSKDVAIDPIKSSRTFLGINGGYARQEVNTGWLSRPSDPNSVRNKTYKDDGGFVGVGLMHDLSALPIRVGLQYTNLLGNNHFLYNYVFDSASGFANANIDVNSQQYTANAYYLFKTSYNFLIYAGGAIGVSVNSVENTINNSPAFGNNAPFYSYTNNAFTYSGEAGLETDLTDRFSVGAFFRYTSLGRMVVEKHSITNSTFEVGDRRGEAYLGGLSLNYTLG